MSTLETVKVKVAEGKALLTSTANSAIAAVLFLLALSEIPGITIPTEWIAYGTAALVALRTLVAFLNPKDPSFGIGADKAPVVQVPVLVAPEDPLPATPLLDDAAIQEAVDAVLLGEDRVG